jgi:hypothetical protein
MKIRVDAKELSQEAVIEIDTHLDIDYDLFQQFGYHELFTFLPYTEESYTELQMTVNRNPWQSSDEILKQHSEVLESLTRFLSAVKHSYPEI